MHADKAERGKSYGCGHVSHLTVLAFDECELYPAGGDVRAESYWRIAFPNPVRGFDDFCLAGLGVVAFDVHAFGEFADCFFSDLPVDLREVRARVLVFRVKQFFDEFSVIR